MSSGIRAQRTVRARRACRYRGGGIKKMKIYVRSSRASAIVLRQFVMS